MATSANQGIVVGVDGSPQAIRAVTWAAREAAGREMLLTLANVLPDTELRMWLDVPPTDEFWRTVERQNREIRSAAVKTAEAAVAGTGSLTLRQRSVSGNAVPTLVDLSKDGEMVVVGSRGFGAIGQRILGSVSRGLAPRRARADAELLGSPDRALHHASLRIPVAPPDASVVDTLNAGFRCRAVVHRRTGPADDRHLLRRGDRPGQLIWVVR